ncbi:MAG: ABC transporter ATP-binding protein [Planctomycetes bacterium]|jgi:ABC-2 type transport system ATP-binding protein|nr:ABC transporter ATP-binding protein [Planctomycetota bacterium]
MNEANSVISVRRLTKVFRDFWMREKVAAVTDLDLDVRPHEVFGLLGPNGSGKSTTIKMILGLLFPSRGQVNVLGSLPTDVAVKSRIGFLPEESYLYPFLDARETLDFYGRLFKQNRRERRRRIDMLLDMVGLSGVAYRRVGEYSKGMQRRIGLAQALINDPDLLILDEPTSGMDPIGTRQFKDLIRTLSTRGKTILVSSHLLGDVEDTCDRVCVLYGGRKRAEGGINDLLAQKDHTQITTGALSDEDLAAVNELLRQRGKSVLDVSMPRDRLESLFLRIVSEAQQQKIATGGAVAGGAVAEFLRVGTGEDQNVIEQLVRKVDEAQQAPSVAPAEAGPKPQPRKEVLEDLISKPHTANAPSEPQKTEPVDVDADRSVIDSLLKDSKAEDE